MSSEDLKGPIYDGCFPTGEPPINQNLQIHTEQVTTLLLKIQKDLVFIAQNIVYLREAIAVTAELPLKED